MGFKIRECRNEINMSQEELSKRSGVSRTIISGLENGTITVTTTETLLRIARAMNKKDVDNFFEKMGVKKRLAMETIGISRKR